MMKGTVAFKVTAAVGEGKGTLPEVLQVLNPSQRERSRDLGKQNPDFPLPGDRLTSSCLPHPQVAGSWAGVPFPSLLPHIPSAAPGY